MRDDNKNILIIGHDSYLATGVNFENCNVNKILRPFDNKEQYEGYDYIINFCIQPEHFTKILSEEEMIDVNIAKNIDTKKTKLVFLSSRKVYGYNTELKSYSETDEIRPFDYYSENKVLIENKLREIVPDNVLIFRTGNIIGELINRKNYKTFIGWLGQELEKNGKVFCTVEPENRKDFISKDYFQYVMVNAVINDLSGIYNIGAGFALPIKELLLHLLHEKYVDFSRATNKVEQFILNCDKLHEKIKPFTKQNLIDKCHWLRNTQWKVC